MSVFQFKKFSLNHHPEVFKFGTDAALLATWTETKDVKSILEVGTGSGVISLMLGQKLSDIPIVGIDRSFHAIDLAQKNLEEFPLPSKIQFLHSPLQDFESSEKFDLIISNPPFFESSTRSPYSLKNETRHTDHLSLSDLMEHSKRLLSPIGRISLVYPHRYLKDIQQICHKVGLYPHHICYTRSKPSAPIKRVLLTIGIQKKEKPEESDLVIHGNFSGYSEMVHKLLKPYLLKL